MSLLTESRCIGSWEEAGEPGVLTGDLVDTQGQFFGHFFQPLD